MKIIKEENNTSPHADSLVRLKKTGNIYEVRYMTRKPQISIKKLDKHCFVDLQTGEVKEFKHATHRVDNLTSVKQSLKNLRDYINANVTDPKKSLFITLTYAENMTDGEQLYQDFRKFNMRLSYYIKQHHFPSYEYLLAIEPQARGSLHAHLLLIFKKRAPYLPNNDMAQLWGHGFIKISAFDNVDNIGAYLSAYLSDMELDDSLNSSNTYSNGFKLVTDVDSNGNTRNKAIIKGTRLKLYPKGFRLFRKSKGIITPTVKECTYAEAMKEIGDSIPTYEKTIKLVDENEKVCNIINYRHYNTKRKPISNKDSCYVEKSSDNPKT